MPPCMLAKIFLQTSKQSKMRNSSRDTKANKVGQQFVLVKVTDEL